MNLKEIVPILREIKELILIKNTLDKDILSMKEASLFLGLSTSQIYKLTSQRLIKFYKPSGKVIFFRKEDLNIYILSKPITPRHETEEAVADFLIQKMIG